MGRKTPKVVIELQDKYIDALLTEISISVGTIEISKIDMSDLNSELFEDTKDLYNEILKAIISRMVKEKLICYTAYNSSIEMDAFGYECMRYGGYIKYKEIKNLEVHKAETISAWMLILTAILAFGTVSLVFVELLKWYFGD